MTAFLPSNLLALFAARGPISYLPPLDKLGHQKKPWPYTGVSNQLGMFEDPNDTPAPTRAENRLEKSERKKKERIEKNKLRLEQALEEWDPHTDPNAVTDAFKTLFIGRLNYDTSESKLRREMEIYGPVKSIQMVNNTTTEKPRGYAFIEFEHERDMHSAYKHADGKKIDGRRIVVDVERGRTVKNWNPRRLGIVSAKIVVVALISLIVRGVIGTVTLVVVTGKVIAIGIDIGIDVEIVEVIVSGKKLLNVIDPELRGKGHGWCAEQVAHNNTLAYESQSKDFFQNRGKVTMTAYAETQKSYKKVPPCGTCAKVPSKIWRRNSGP